MRTPKISAYNILDQLATEMARRIGQQKSNEPSMKLAEFVTQAWHIIEPSNPLQFNWHHHYICDRLEAAARGETRRLIINVPPRTGKSSICTILWPAWIWSFQPQQRFLCVSYSSSLSLNHSVKRRDVIKSPWYTARWGEQFALSEDSNQKAEFINSARGHMIATSVGGTAVGKGGSVLIGDDLLTPEEALSETERNRANRFLESSIIGRQDDPRTGIIVLVMQRLHQLDPTGYLLEKGGWEHLCFPVIAETDEEWRLSDGRVIVRKPGDLLWPERFNQETVDEIKRERGPYIFAGQYQQRPTPLSGGVIQKDWLRFWHQDQTGETDCLLPDKDDFDSVIMSVDCAFANTKESSYVVIQIWAKLKANIYLLDQRRERIDFPATCAAVQSMKTRYPIVSAIVVENKANGPAVIAEMKSRIPGMVPWNPKGSKRSRMEAASAYFASGNVFLPPPNRFTWMQAFIQELLLFPNADNDDQCDALSQAIARFRRVYIRAA